MRFLKLTVTETLNIQSLSTQARRPMSPRGGLYLSGRTPQAGDIIVDSISCAVNRIYFTFLQLDNNNVLQNESEPDVVTSLRKLSLDDPESVLTTAAPEKKSLASLENRFARLASLDNVRIIGNVSISFEVTGENDEVLGRAGHDVEIKKLSDFLKAKAVLEAAIRREPAEISVPERAVSALRV